MVELQETNRDMIHFLLKKRITIYNYVFCKRVAPYVKAEWLIGMCQFLLPGMGGEPAGIVQQLFLDIPIDHMLNLHLSLENAQLDKPWADEYVNAFFESRLGNAIWARYQMFGDLKDGLIDGDWTIIESITEDAVGHKHTAPNDHAAIMPLYEQLSSADGHAEVRLFYLLVGKTSLDLDCPILLQSPVSGFCLVCREERVYIGQLATIGLFASSPHYSRSDCGLTAC